MCWSPTWRVGAASSGFLNDAFIRMRSWLLVGRRCANSPSSQVCAVGVAAVGEFSANAEFVLPEGIGPNAAETPAPKSTPSGRHLPPPLKRRAIDPGL